MEQVSALEVQNTVLSIIAKMAESTPDRISLQDRFIGDLGFDSMQSMEALARIADVYEIQPNIEMILKLQTVGEVIEHLLSHLEEKMRL